MVVRGSWCWTEWLYLENPETKIYESLSFLQKFNLENVKSWSFFLKGWWQWQVIAPLTCRLGSLTHSNPHPTLSTGKDFPR